MKLLVLIISSKGFPYDKYKEYWKQYMNLDKDIECYFLELTESNRESYIEEDTIFINGVESYHNILYKTQEALKLFDLRSYDYIFRTNLSSFIVFYKYKKWLNTLPKENVYNGSICWYTRYIYASGCGFTMSPDVAEIVRDFDEKSEIIKYIDDVTIGKICMLHNIKVTSAPLNCIFMNTIYSEVSQFNQYECAFHYRTKSNDRKEDLDIYKLLLDMYYPY